ncbi:GntR family transcriptional regulator [Roseomonas sp. HJA6]|uniref:GntR family transcriptional regulator n=1 Tax=Roseomonas alba TaxID=2846776 RepID=A0ABS7AAG9_9PROT|nr:GntR family transcriptional regulator [Neoroseomonas alba]
MSRPRGTVETIVAKTRDAILSGRMALGQRLVEADLTEEFGVSRASIREALQRLAAEGLVSIVPHRGALVRRFTRKEIADRYEIRQSLESLAASLAAGRIAEGDNRAVLMAALPSPAETAAGLSAAHRALNLRFHRAIAALSGNPQLAQIIEQMWLPAAVSAQRDALGIPLQWEASLREHEGIAEAILAGDAIAAGAAMRDHLRRGCERVLSTSRAP